MKYLVISQPKAGTYLSANLLEEMGLIWTKLHFADNSVRSFQDINISEARMNNTHKTINRSLPDSLNLIPDGGFAVSHMKHSVEIEKKLSNVKKILLVRNFDETYESTKTFLKETNRKFSLNNLQSMHDAVIPWKNCSDVFFMQFDDMINKNVIVLDKLQYFLFNELRVDSLQTIKSALNKDSITKSNKRREDKHE